MEIYLDANATTPVLPLARDAALATMGDDFGNPSSAHGTGLRARALLDATRALARRVLGAPTGRLLFVSGATEGLQTAVLSALTGIAGRRARGLATPELVLYGATEHKAVPESIHHWNAVLRLDLEVQAIPVAGDGRHDLDWLRAHAPRAGLVCTMAANNETGVISDLDGIQAAIAGSGALWLVDSVQALGKLPLRLCDRPIDYAPFSGHKLYAPKGIGLMYVREGAPFTPLVVGGGQEDAQRSGTENMPGIAALGAVLAELEAGRLCRPAAELQAHRERLADALREAFPGVRFNAPFDRSLPTTLNVSVPGIEARRLLDLFDAAGLRASGGSACSAAKARPSHVLEAMGVPDEVASSAIRLSFGPATEAPFIDEACRRLRACGDALRAAAAPPRRITRFVADDGALCYVVADAKRRMCAVIDPRPSLEARLSTWIEERGLERAGVLATRGPSGLESLAVGELRLARSGAGEGSAWLVHAPRANGGERLLAAFVGDASIDGSWAQSLPADAVLLPGRDDHDRFAMTRQAGRAVADADLGLDADGATKLLREGAVLVDVRDLDEQALGDALRALPGVCADTVRRESVPLPSLPEALAGWLDEDRDVALVFVCRSGNRSAKAARALRALGHARAWSLAGGLAQA